MGKKVVIVIGERMGKGNHVADGIQKAGGEAYVIPGMAADMKLGDVMHEKNADLGLSFCGSGGAGALMASNTVSYTHLHALPDGTKLRNRRPVFLAGVLAAVVGVQYQTLLITIA